MAQALRLAALIGWSELGRLWDSASHERTRASTRTSPAAARAPGALASHRGHLRRCPQKVRTYGTLLITPPRVRRAAPQHDLALDDRLRLFNSQLPVGIPEGVHLRDAGQARAAGEAVQLRDLRPGPGTARWSRTEAPAGPPAHSRMGPGGKGHSCPCLPVPAHHLHRAPVGQLRGRVATCRVCPLLRPADEARGATRGRCAHSHPGSHALVPSVALRQVDESVTQKPWSLARDSVLDSVCLWHTPAIRGDGAGNSRANLASARELSQLRAQTARSSSRLWIWVWWFESTGANSLASAAQPVKVLRGCQPYPRPRAATRPAIRYPISPSHRRPCAPASRPSAAAC